MSGDDRHGKKKKIAIISVSALILVAMVVAVAVGVTQSQKGGKDDKKPATTSKAIEAVCQPTDYKDTCQQTLTQNAGNVTDPKDLIKAAFKIAKDKLQEVIDKSATLHDLAKSDMGNQALQNCRELIEFSINDIQRSFGKLGPFDVTKIKAYVSDLQAWLSASISYEQKCLDGFNSTPGPAGDKMKDYLKQAMELTKNGLAMVTEIGKLMGTGGALKPQQRRLLGEDSKIIPSWIDGRKLDLATASSNSLKPDVVVAQDGSGKHKSIQDALKDVPKDSQKTFVIYIKEGEYKENVIISKEMTNVLFIGDGPTKTKITGNKNFADGVHPFSTATVAVIGDYFIAKDIGFENSAGPKGHQAVALRVQSDMSIFYNCQIDGYQNTLFTQTYRQFYRDCTISGAVDMIFGDAAVVFQNCKMIVKKPEANDKITITSQERSDKRQPSAIVFQNSTISAEKDYKDTKTAYLGRPGHTYSRTVIMQSQLDDVINPEGWTEWTGDTNHDSCWFGEYSNRGNGASTNKRVSWYKMVTREQAEEFSPGKLLLGDNWIKPSGVSYEAGLMRV